MSLTFSLIATIAATLVFVWLSICAARVRRPLLRWSGIIASGLFVIMGLAVAGFGILGAVKLNAVHPRVVPTFAVSNTTEQVARGERLAYLCVGCHSSTGKLPLDGGEDNFAVGIGKLYAPNLTPAGPLKRWSDGELVRALRQGVDKDGRTLFIMPSEDYRTLSDRDAAALVAYLRVQPPIKRELPEQKLNLMGAVLVGLGVYPSSLQDPVNPPVIAPQQAATPEYGQYLVSVAGCATCHGKDLRGGTSNPFVPAGPNLPASVASWREADFARAMRSGQTPSGRMLDPQQMPWQDLSRTFEDDELSAIYAYLKSLATDAQTQNDATPAKTAQRSDGGQIYTANCAGCHGEDGRGGVGPALGGNRQLEDTAFVLERLLSGKGQMPAWDGVLSNEQIAVVGSFIRLNFGNDFGSVTSEDVARHR